MNIEQKKKLRDVYCRVTYGTTKVTSAAAIGRELGIGQQNLYSFKNKLYLSHGDCVRLQNYFIKQGWMKGEIREAPPQAANEERSVYAPKPAGVVRVGELGDPESVLIGGLQNALVLAQDGTVPLRARLVHIRKQLRFLLDNFLDDTSLPGGPGGG